jgi:hypothetical protein
MMCKCVHRHIFKGLLCLGIFVSVYAQGQSLSFFTKGLMCVEYLDLYIYAHVRVEGYVGSGDPVLCCFACLCIGAHHGFPKRSMCVAYSRIHVCELMHGNIFPSNGLLRVA